MKRRIGFWTSGFVKWICLLLACALSLTLLSLPNIKSAQAAGQVYYVDNVNGSDANSGLTEALAWKNLPRVNDATFAPGDQILFKRGGIWKGLYQILIPPSSGTAAAPIVFGSYGTGDLPIIDGEGIRRCVKVENKSYLTFQELDCRNGNVHGLDLDTVDHITIQDCVITDAAWAGVYSSAGQYVLVENCTISGGYAGIEFVDNTQYSRIHNNVVHNCSHAGIYPGHSSAYNDIDNNDCYANGAGIYLSGSDHNLVHNNHSYLNVGEEGLYGYGIGVLCGSNNEIYDNEINNNTSDGIEFWSGDPLDNPDYYTCDANKVYRNKIYSNARTGILLDGSVTLQAIDNEIFYNLIYDNGDPGIRISIDSGSGNKLYNNTIVGNAGVSASAYFGITFDLVGSGIGGWDVKNNIVTDNTRGEFYGRSGCTVTNDHNQYHRISGTVVNYNETTYDTAHVTDFEATALAVDPLFVDETNHDYRLQPSSSAINAGINVGLTTDLNGNPIIGQPEIGCFESNQVAPAPTPTPPTSFTLSGQVTQADNSGLDGVTLSRSDGGSSVVTANGGSYSLTVPSGWSGQLTPSYSNGSFDPVSRSYSNVSANQSGQDFRWTAPAPTPTPPTSFTLAGRVTQADNSGLDGVTLSRSDGGGSVVTANGGLYSVTVPSGWSGQLTPSYSNGSLNNVTVPSGWSGQITPSNSSNFDPVSRTYMNVTSEQSSQDYRWSPSDVPSIRVLTPNGGESWRIGSKQRITWTSTNLAGNISIEFSTDGGRTWAALFASTPNDGQEQWTVAGVAGNQNQVRIISTVTPSIADTSDSNFAIVKSTKKMRIAVNQGWNLIATPVQPDSNADQIFASLPSGWRFYAWDSASLCYLTGTEVVSSIGNGYWLYSPIASNLDIEGDSYAGVLFEKPLPMGWNLIGSPSVDSYQLSNLRIELNANTYTYQEAVDLHLIAPGLFAYKGSQYEDAGTTGLFEPGFGYWIKTLVADCILVF
jgi:parallel beta-helix repeat protein